MDAYDITDQQARITGPQRGLATLGLRGMDLVSAGHRDSLGALPPGA